MIMFDYDQMAMMLVQIVNYLETTRTLFQS